MAQLIVRRLDVKLVKRLKRRAAEHGVSMEEEHRRILQEILEAPAKPRMSLKEYLVAPPHLDIDLMDYIPKREKRNRKVDVG